jgi:hypothetical protein
MIDTYKRQDGEALGAKKVGEGGVANMASYAIKFVFDFGDS